MPDFLIRDIDAQTAERIKALAQSRGCSLNQAIVDLLRCGLSADSDASGQAPDAPTTDRLDEDEARAFKEAMSALQGLPDDTPY
jgi:hypothetical protein